MLYKPEKGPIYLIFESLSESGFLAVVVGNSGKEFASGFFEEVIFISHGRFRAARITSSKGIPTLCVVNRLNPRENFFFPRRFDLGHVSTVIVA